MNWIKEEQRQDPQYEMLRQRVITKKEEYWKIGNEGILKYKGRLWVPGKLCREVIKQAHESSYTMHLGAFKMYQDLKKKYWWRKMKKDVLDNVVRCLTCQQVKVEH